MALIGTFSKTAEGYAGTIRTMTINVKAAIVLHDKNSNDKAPDFRIIADGKELGAAWRAKPKADGGMPYLRVELDDPSFAAPISAALFENGEEGKANLVWSRTKGSRGEK
ncbi:MAG: DUF736 domain-containing protein [Parvularculaceae bacterium]